MNLTIDEALAAVVVHLGGNVENGPRYEIDEPDAVLILQGMFVLFAALPPKNAQKLERELKRKLEDGV